MVANVYLTGMGSFVIPMAVYVIKFVTLDIASDLCPTNAMSAATMPTSTTKTNAFVTQVGQGTTAVYMLETEPFDALNVLDLRKTIVLLA